MEATQAKSRRFAGLFVIGIVAIMVLSHTQPAVRQQYAADHGWPSAWGTVTFHQERSRVVHDSDGPDTTIYQVEFWILLDLPLAQCHPMNKVVLEGKPHCLAIVETPEVNSQTKAQRWIDRHPTNSTVQVHYDPHGQEVKFAGESFWNVYPWKEIAVELGSVLVGLLFWRAGRLPDAARHAKATSSDLVESTPSK